MVQSNNRFFDEIGRLMNNAAGMTQGFRREVETMMRGQADRILRELDVVKRDEFEAVKEMARLAREEAERLQNRIAALEAGGRGSAPAASFGSSSHGASSAGLGASSPGSASSGYTGSASTGSAGANSTSHLPSSGIESTGGPHTGPQTPTRPSSAAGDPSI